MSEWHILVNKVHKQGTILADKARKQGVVQDKSHNHPYCGETDVNFTFGFETDLALLLVCVLCQSVVLILFLVWVLCLPCSTCHPDIAYDSMNFFIHSNNGTMIWYTQLPVQDEHTVTIIPVLRLAKSVSISIVNHFGLHRLIAKLHGSLSMLTKMADD